LKDGTAQRATAALIKNEFQLAIVVSPQMNSFMLDKD
jgi:hypothetical protein